MTEATLPIKVENAKVMADLAYNLAGRAQRLTAALENADPELPDLARELATVAELLVGCVNHVLTGGPPTECPECRLVVPRAAGPSVLHRQSCSRHPESTATPTHPSEGATP